MLAENPDYKPTDLLSVVGGSGARQTPPGCPIAMETENLRRLVLTKSINRFPEWLHLCRRVFDGFHACLRRHIELEELADVHRKLAGKAPGQTCRVQELEKEHRRLLDECAALALRLHGPMVAAESVAHEIVRRMENVLALFRRHEDAEAQLMREVFGEAGEPSSAVDPQTGRCLHCRVT
jgi:hypothetical protein